MANQRYGLLPDKMWDLWDYYAKNLSLLDDKKKPKSPTGKPKLDVSELNAPSMSANTATPAANTAGSFDYGGLADAMGSAGQAMGAMGGGDDPMMNPPGVSVGATPQLPISPAIRGEFSQVFPITRQHGGPVKRMAPYIVGEKGPEIMVPESDGFVMPNENQGGSGAGMQPPEAGQIDTQAHIDQILSKVLSPQPERKILGLPEGQFHQLVEAIGMMAYGMDPRSPGGRMGYMAASGARERRAAPGLQNKSLVDMASSLMNIENTRSQMGERDAKTEEAERKRAAFAKLFDPQETERTITTDRGQLGSGAFGTEPVEIPPMSGTVTDMGSSIAEDVYGEKEAQVIQALGPGRAPIPEGPKTPGSREALYAGRVHRGEMSDEEFEEIMSKGKGGVKGTQPMRTTKGWDVSFDGTIWNASKSVDGKIITEPYTRVAHGDPQKMDAMVGMKEDVDYSLKGKEFLQNYDEKILARARQLVAGKGPWPTGRLAKDPEWKAVMDAALIMDPALDANAFKIRSSTRRSFTSGMDKRTMNSINTLVAHLKSLKGDIEKLENIAYPTANKLKNKYLYETGSAKITDIKQAITAVSSEMASVFKGTGASATDQEMVEWRKSLNTDMSPEQLNSWVAQGIELMAGRLQALKYTFKQGMATDLGTINVLSGSSRKIITEFGLNPDDYEMVEYIDPKEDLSTDKNLSKATAQAQRGATGATEAPEDVSKRFNADPEMKGYTLGKQTPQGYEVLVDGKLVGHWE